MLAGTLDIQFMADIAQLQRDMKGAQGYIADATGEMQRMAGLAAKALGAIGVGLSVVALRDMVKGVYDAAEALNDLSIKTGASVESLSAMQAIGRLTGTSVDVIGTAMNKLAINMASGNEESKGAAAALRALGVDFNAFAQMRPEDKMVALAQAMGKFQDGSGKSAAAMALMGRNGAELLPYLKDLASAGTLVATVTSEQAAMADLYNDTSERTKLRVEAMQRAFAFALLPALIDVQSMTASLSLQIGEYLGGSARSTTERFDAMAGVIRIVGTTLEALVILASDVAFVFKGIGTEIGGLAAQAAAFLSGNFAGAGEIHRQMQTDAAAARAELDKFQASILGTTDRILQGRDALNNHSQSAAENGSELRRLTGLHGAAVAPAVDFRNATEEQAKAAKKAADEYAKLLETYDKQAEASARKLIEQQAEIEGGRKLTEAEKLYIQVMSDVRDGKVAYNDLVARGTLQKLQETLATSQAIAEEKEAMKVRADIAKVSEKYLADQDKTTEALRAGNVALIEENEKLRLGESAWAARQAAVMRAQAADLEWQAANEGGNFKLEEQARLLRQRAELATNGTILREAQAVAAEWQKVTEQIGAGLTDSLFRAFESGKGFFQTLWDGIKNLFKTTVLRLVMQPVQQGLTNIVGGILGVGQQFDASGRPVGAGGQGAGVLGSVMSAYNGLSGLYQGGASAIGYGATYSGATYGTAFGSQQSGMLAAQEAGMGTASAGFGTAATYAGYAAAIYAGYVKAQSDYAEGNNNDKAIRAQNEVFGGNFGQWSTEGALSNLLSSLGVNDKWSSILSGSTAVAKILDKLGLVSSHHYGSVVGIDAQGAASTMYGDGSTILDHFREETDVSLRVLGGTSTNLLNGLSKLFGGTGGFSEILKFASDGKDPSIGQAFIMRNGAQVGYVGEGSDFAHYSKNGKEAFDAFTQDVAGATRAAIDAIGLPKWARETFAELASDATLDDLAKVIAQVASFQAALRGLQEDVAPLGGVFARVAGLSGDALKQLTDFAGGIQAFGAKVGDYVKNYYSEGEQAALNASALQQQLLDAGFGSAQIKGLSTRDDFRSLVNGLDVGSEAGRRQLSTLLTVQGSFAALADYIKAAGSGTLGGLASRAPVVGPLGSLSATDATVATVDGLTSIDTSVQTAGANIVDAIVALQGSVEAGLAAVTAASESVTTQLRTWDNGGSLLVTSEP